MDGNVRGRLAGMMALVYAVQGAFWPVLAVHLNDLGIDGRARGRIFATMALGSLAMPLGVGRLVDRSLAAERYLALSYALGTGLLVALAAGVSTDPTTLFALFLVYWLIIAPTYGMAAALALRNLARPAEEFGGVRLWGTIGWMSVGWLITGVLAVAGRSGAYPAFWVAAGFSLALSAYSLILPHTPPLAGGRRGRADWSESRSLLRRGPLLVFLATAFGVSLTTPYIYQVLPTYLQSRGLPRSWVSTALTLGQLPEIVALAALPWMLRTLSYRRTMALGIGAYVLRYGSLALDPPLWVALAGIPLHGIGIACFTVGGQVYMDAHAPPRHRAGAQALLVVLTSGIGTLLGSLVAGEGVVRSGGDEARVFLIPCVIDLALLLYFSAGFRPDTAGPDRIDPSRPPHPSTGEARRATAVRLGNLATEPADG